MPIRFSLRFVNGAWVSFDAHTMRHVERFKLYADGVASFRKHGVPVPLPHPVPFKE